MDQNLKDMDDLFDTLLADKARVQKALERGVRQACRIHRALDTSMVIWEDGRIKEIPAQDLPWDPLE